MTCKIVRESVGKEYDKQHFALNCQDENGQRVGRLEVWRTEVFDVKRIRVMTVKHADVLPRFRRRGIGTSLYEAAAKIACEEYGLPLASDRSTSRSKLADNFWKKQGKKRRATCIGDKRIEAV
jgi:GNAT superfamily N-acetyltransferase